MKPVKRIDVVLPEAIVQPFTDLIEKHRFHTYSITTGLAGKSRGGMATAGLCDAAVMIICDLADATELVKQIDAFLDRYGGAGCVIDAEGLGIT